MTTYHRNSTCLYTYRTKGTVTYFSWILFNSTDISSYSAELANKINALFRRLKRFGFKTCNITVSDLIDTSGRDLFRKLCSSEHSLHHLLPPERKYSNNAKSWSIIPMNSRSIVLTCIKSLLLFNHCRCTFDFLNICELSFNRDFAHCWRAFDMSNKYYLLTYIINVDFTFIFSYLDICLIYICLSCWY